MDFIRENGFEVVSVTADDVRTVKRFAARRDIKYPLLSDVNKEAIRAFNLFNDRFPEGSRYHGTAVPQVVVVNAEGVVTHTFSGHGYTADEEIEGIVERALQGGSG